VSHCGLNFECPLLGYGFLSIILVLEKCNMDFWKVLEKCLNFVLSVCYEPCQVGRFQKGKTNLDFTGARDSEWQWHQLDRMQVFNSLQTDNHASTPPFSFYRSMLCIRGTSHGPVSVRLLQVGVLLKRLNGGSHKQHHTIPPKTLVFWCQRSPQNSTGVTPYEGAECRCGWSESATFD